MIHGSKRINVRAPEAKSFETTHADELPNSESRVAQHNEPSAYAAHIDEALQAMMRVFTERLAMRVAQLLEQREASATTAASGWIDKAAVSRALGISIATMDRLVREGAPVHVVGARRRFDLAELRAWLAARGTRAPVPVRRAVADNVAADEEILDLARNAGLRAR